MLTSSQKKNLRAQAHHLDALFQVGNGGVSENLVKAIDEALAKRELLKVKVNKHQEGSEEILTTIAEQLGAEIAGQIGHVGILYRPAAEVKARKVDPNQR